MRRGQRDVILRALGAGNRWYDCAHIKRQRVGVDRCVIRVAPHAVFLGIGFDQRNAVLFAARGAQVTQGFAVDREETTGSTIFRCHVGDGRAVCQWQVIQTFAVEFDEFGNNAFCAQHFDDFQHKVGTGGAFHHAACQFETHNFGDQHGNRLTQHRGLGLDPANAPTQNGHAVNHGGVAVRTDKRIRISNFDAVLVFVGPNGLRQIFKVHLVADAGAGGHNAEVVKRLLAPLKECVTLDVTLVFTVNVHLERARVAEFIDHD